MPRLASLLESKLPEETVETLRIVGQLAADGESGAAAAYLVGGSVRDLVLGREPNDPDIAVVGDGPGLARALAVKIGGEVNAVSQFGTAIVESPRGRIDVATARSETYPGPAELPRVTPAQMEDDLRRRDFSVNAMAVSLSPDSWGDLLDPHKGFADCARRRIRILHDRSFRDDPTRILRAVRYEVRLGFTVTMETAEALDRDLHYFDQLSSARLLAELRKMLAEPGRADMLRRAEALGVLGAISSSLRVSEAGLKAMERFRDSGKPVDELIYVACLTASLTEAEANALIERLEPDRDWQDVIRGAAAFRDIAAVLESPALLPSEVVDLLRPVPVPVIEYQRVAGPKTRQRNHIESYLRRHREIRVELTGDDLAELGVPRGPIMGRLLDELKTARLDGKVASRDQEAEYVRRRLPVLLSRESVNGIEGLDQPTGAAVP